MPPPHLCGSKAATISTENLREIFLQRLPSNAHVLLAATRALLQNNLLELVERMLDINPPMLAALPNRIGTDHMEIEFPCQEVSKLWSLLPISWTKHGQHTIYQALTLRPGTNGILHQMQMQPTATHCWYHQRFGTGPTVVSTLAACSCK